MLNNTRVTILVGYVALLACTPYVVHAELRSSQYTLSAYGFGGTEHTTFSSANFSLTKANAGIGVHIGTFDPISPSSNRQGSRIYQVQNMLQGTSSIHSEGQVSQTIVAQNNRDIGVLGFLGREFERVEDVSIESDSSTDETQENNRNQSASVIGSYVEGQYLWLRDAFSNLFAHRSARAIVLVGVVGMLLYIRSYTRIGRIYRPF